MITIITSQSITKHHKFLTPKFLSTVFLTSQIQWADQVHTQTLPLRLNFVELEIQIPSPQAGKWTGTLNTLRKTSYKSKTRYPRATEMPKKNQQFLQSGKVISCLYKKCNIMIFSCIYLHSGSFTLFSFLCPSFYRLRQERSNPDGIYIPPRGAQIMLPNQEYPDDITTRNPWTITNLEVCRYFNSPRSIKMTYHTLKYLDNVTHLEVPR